MKFSELEHVLRAAGAVAGISDLVVIGSQAVLATRPDGPPELLVSVEADVYPRHQPELADLIDGSIGEGSPFHETFGYYAQGVGPETATLPRGWEERLVPINTPATGGVTGWCLEIHDLIISKLVAARPKDLEFIRVAIEFADAATLRQRLEGTELSDGLREFARARLRALQAESPVD